MPDQPERPLVRRRGDVRELWLLPEPERSPTGVAPDESRHVADLEREPPSFVWVAREPRLGRRLDSASNLAVLVDRLARKLGRKPT